MDEKQIPFFKLPAVVGAMDKTGGAGDAFIPVGFIRGIPGDGLNRAVDGADAANPAVFGGGGNGGKPFGLLIRMVSR